MEGLLADQRDVIGGMTRLVKNFKKMGKANFTTAIARGRMQLLNHQWETCRKLHRQIEVTAAEDVYYEAYDYFTTIINDLTPGALTLPPTAEATATVTGNANAVKLPKLDLPRFSGEYTGWIPFRDMYVSKVHKHPALSNVQRFQYLLSCLEGDALETLKTVPITEANYVTAWETLTSQYNHERAIVYAHCEILFNLPAATKKSSKELKRIRDSTNNVISALKNLKRPVEHWDDLLVFLTVQKLDNQSREGWELELKSSTKVPSYAELNEFLAGRIRALEAVSATAPNSSQVRNASATQTNRASSTRAHVTTNQSCILCKQDHPLHQCEQFKALPVEQRQTCARSNNRCANCLAGGHKASKCKSKFRCRTCSRQHHTLLHLSVNNNSNTPSSNEPHTGNNSVMQARTFPEFIPSTNANVHLANESNRFRRSVLLATAWVNLSSESGKSVRARALLDQGSESSFITESIAQTLRVKRIKSHTSISGIGGSESGTVRSQASVAIKPCNSASPVIEFNALVLPKLTSYAPRDFVQWDTWSYLPRTNLADPCPASSDPIDILIGADVYGSVLREGLRRGPTGSPAAQMTLFGWVIFGPVTRKSNETSGVIVLHSLADKTLHEAVERFWRLEELPSKVPLSDEDQRCEQHFVNTHTRLPDGRYMVRLPFKSEPPIPIGESRHIAQRLFLTLEGRLQRNAEHRSLYNEFMSNYLQLSHMELATESKPTSSTEVYLPHHHVIRDSSTTTRLRVVFNASCLTSNGTSLNSHMLTGPKL